MNKMKSEKGITLVALVVTIVVLLILAGITITYVLGENSIFKLAQEAKNKTEEAIRNEQDDLGNLTNWLKEEYGGGDSTTTGWTQDKTTVTNGIVTLEVGQAVTGYTVNVAGNDVGDGNWYVLGAKDGKLLITTNSNQGTVTLSGQDGFAKGVATLNTEGAKFSDGNMAETARSIIVEDINRVTGYDPDVAKYNDGTSNPYQWKNEVTYTLNEADSKVHYQGTKYPTTDTTSSYTTFTYWNGSNWIPLVSGESATLTHDYYYYNPQTLSTTSSSETEVNGSTKAYTLLFANTSSSDTYYWLSSQFVSTRAGFCNFGIRNVGNGFVSGSRLCYSDGSAYSGSFGVRPVVSLKSNIKVASDGTLSM